MKTRSLVFCFLACLLFSCSDERRLTRKWTLDGSSTTEGLADLLEAMQGREVYASMLSHYDFFLRFYPDHTYTMGSKTHFMHGTWAVEERALTLNPESNTDTENRPVHFRVAALTADEVVLVLNSANAAPPGEVVAPDAPAVVFKGKGDSYDFSENDDFYSLPLNQWRLKPTRRQTEAELKTRLLNHLDYLTAWLTVAIEREAGEMDLSNLNSPIVFSVSGVGLRYFDDHADFNATFFDETDAHTAHDLLARAVETGAQRFQLRKKQVKQQARTDYDDETARGLAYFRAYVEEVKGALQ